MGAVFFEKSSIVAFGIPHPPNEGAIGMHVGGKWWGFDDDGFPREAKVGTCGGWSLRGALQLERQQAIHTRRTVHAVVRGE